MITDRPIKSTLYTADAPCVVPRCFPEDLLLAVEALPSTIDALAEVPEESGDSAREDDDMQEEDDLEEGEEEQGDEDELEEDEEEEEEAVGVEGVAGDAPHHEEGVDPADRGGDDSENASQASTDSDSEREDNESDRGEGSDRTPKTVGASKSRRKRLQRRRSSATSSLGTTTRGSSGNIPGRGWVRRVPASGSSLTAPFLTWLLWLEHCRRASELESKARSAARAFVARAGSLAPVLEACFRVLRASQVGGWVAGVALPGSVVRLRREVPDLTCLVASGLLILWRRRFGSSDTDAIQE